MAKNGKVFPRGVRPVALGAVAERERLAAHPHRAQAAVNHLRAIDRDRKAEAERNRAARKGRRR